MNEHRVRLQKYLSAHGIASRRGAEEMIAAGRVRVNGALATLGQTVMPDADVVEVDGKKLTNKARRVYIMLNKPKGYLTTVSDDRGRNTVMELVENLDTRVYPVGRLDYDSEGLLLFTNDGDFANSVAHPSNGKTKTYEVSFEGDAKKAARMLSRPIMVDGRTVRAVSVKVVSVTASRSILQIAIEEGRNRQIRKMCSACGIKISSLRRVSIGTLKLGTLETGKWRYLTDEEVVSLRCNREA